MTEYVMTIAEFMEEIRPELEHQVDEMIAAEAAPNVRQMMLRHREEIIARVVDKTEIANLRHRLAEAEAQLAPRRPSDALH
jgi:hypothetical protein